ncbi:MAG: transposase [Gammaproteobacteria bacterium]
MVRPLRIEYPGAIYHLTARGNARADIYRSDRDRLTFLLVLGQTCECYHWACYAWCLMSNHYHLVIETAEANLSRGMRQLNGIYSQTFNRTHQRVGHVFQGRYKAILVEKEAYLLEVVRYVLLNPVRARMANAAGQYRWSSYRAMIGRAESPAWLARDAVLRQFAREMTTAKRQFIRFVQDGKNQPRLWEQLRHQLYLGDEQFIQRLENQVDQKQDFTEIPRCQRRGNGKSLADYRKTCEQRDEAIIAAYQSGQYTQKEIASEFGLHYSSISKIVKKQEMMKR